MVHVMMVKVPLHLFRRELEPNNKAYDTQVMENQHVKIESVRKKADISQCAANFGGILKTHLVM